MPPSHSGGCGSASAETQVHACLRDTFFPQRETARDPEKISGAIYLEVHDNVNLCVGTEPAEAGN